MWKQLLLLLALGVIVQGGLLSRFFNHETTTTTTEPPRRPLYINNNLPIVESGCEAHYECKKKLTQLPTPRPCVKYCLKRIDCPNNVKVRGKANQCVELDEELVIADYEAQRAAAAYNAAAGGKTTTEKSTEFMEVAMIDFPCQPGYLPDSRGRCREVW